MFQRANLTLVAAALVALSVTACGPSTIAKADVEKSAMDALTAAVGKPAPQITCPGEMKLEAGASQVCSTVLDGKTYDVTVTITAVDDNGKGSFTVVVASAPRP